MRAVEQDEAGATGDRFGELVQVGTPPAMAMFAA
jgi:hypothetical protein